MQLVAGPQAYGNYGPKPTGIKETSGLVKPETSHIGDPQNTQSFGAKEQKPGALENPAMTAGEKPAEANIDSNVQKEQFQQASMQGNVGNGMD